MTRAPVSVLTTMTMTMMITVALGCDGAEPGPTSPPAGAQSTPVAAVELPQGQSFEIYEQPDGSFAYSQSGNYGVAPMPIPESLWQEGDPVKIWRTLAPERAVPVKLTAAVARAIERTRALSPGASDNAARQPTVADGAASAAAPRGDGVEQRRQALGSRDTTTNNWTGSPGCPWEFFQVAAQEGRAFCPANGPRSWCQQSMAWAFHSAWDVAGAYGAVCTDWGTSVLKVSNGDPNQASDSWWVQAGTWRYVRIAQIGSCGWFSCDTVRNFKKFDLTDTGFGPASSHFGGVLGF
jgi:hypothetical protein